MMNHAIGICGDDGVVYTLGITTENYGDSEYSVVYIPKNIAKGNLRKIWNAFVCPAYRGDPGEPFVNKPCFYREGNLFVISQYRGCYI